MKSIQDWKRVAQYTAQEVKLIEPCEFEYWNGIGLTFRQDVSRVFYVTANSIMLFSPSYIAQSAVVVDRETGSVMVYQPSGGETPDDKNVNHLLPLMVSEEVIDGRLNISELKQSAVITFLPNGYHWPHNGWELC